MMIGLILIHPGPMSSDTVSAKGRQGCSWTFVFEEGAPQKPLTFFYTEGSLG